jgi:hypothetical protein
MDGDASEDSFLESSPGEAVQQENIEASVEESLEKMLTSLENTQKKLAAEKAEAEKEEQAANTRTRRSGR